MSKGTKPHWYVLYSGVINDHPHPSKTETKGRTRGGVDFYAKTINQNVINRNILKTEFIETLRSSYNVIFNYEQTRALLRLERTMNLLCH